MKKIIITAIIALLFIGGTFLFATRFQQEETPTEQNPTTVFPTGENSGSTELEDVITIQGAQGQIEVNNFLDDSDNVEDTVNGGLFLGNQFPSNESSENYPPYVIQYFSPTNYFNIVLSSEPIRDARLHAEAYLQDKLGLTKMEMCSLNYMVSTPNFVNEYYSGMDLRFSFCPGATPL